MARRRGARETYDTASDRVREAFEKDQQALAAPGRHAPDEPAGHYPHDAAEAARMSHPDWPWVELAAALGEAHREFKRLNDGISRHERRRPQQKGSSAPLIGWLALRAPDLFRKPYRPLTKERIGELQRAREVAGLRWVEDGALTRAIRRERIRRARQGIPADNS